MHYHRQSDIIETESHLSVSYNRSQF